MIVLKCGKVKISSGISSRWRSWATRRTDGGLQGRRKRRREKGAVKANKTAGFAGSVPKGSSLQLLTKRSQFGRMAPLKSARLELVFAGLRETT